MSDPYGVQAATRPTDTLPRCRVCKHLLAELVTRPWRIRCKCRTVNGSTALTSTAYPDPVPRSPDPSARAG